MPDDIKSQMLNKLEELGYSENNAKFAVSNPTLLETMPPGAVSDRFNPQAVLGVRQEALGVRTIEALSLTSDKLAELRKSSERLSYAIIVLTAVLVILTAVLVISV